MTKSIKFKKLAFSSAGEIVDRISGKLHRVKNLIIKGNRAYRIDKKSGQPKLYGYFGKQTDAQKQETERLQNQRNQRRQREAIARQKQQAKKPEYTPPKKAEKPKTPSKPKKISKETIEDIYKIPKELLPPIKALTQEEMNIKRALDNRVRDHKLRQETADEIFKEWKLAATDKERSAVWDKVKKNDPEKGYNPSDYDELLYYVETGVDFVDLRRL